MLKAALKASFPQTFTRASNAWNARKIKRFTAKMDQLLATFTRHHGLRVTAGPFAGMAYVSDAVCSAILPKLVGSYESELHETIGKCIASAYPRIIDVGCAEGYYAVGFARAMPQTKVFAFDTDAKARDLCTRLALANDVADRVTVLGECSLQTLKELGIHNALIICDCEGYEATLLRPDLLPELLETDLIVELHDFAAPGIRNQILASFSATHDCLIFDPQPHDPGKYPALECLIPSDRVFAVDEFRYHATQFAYLRRKTLP
jgi:hypothetical protein